LPRAAPTNKQTTAAIGTWRAKLIKKPRVGSQHPRNIFLIFYQKSEKKKIFK